MTEPQVIRMIPVEDISPSPLNPRSEVGDVADLGASISTLGIIQPLTIRPAGNGSYVLVAGGRRLAAALAAGLNEVPTIVREMDDKTALAIALVENCQRLDISATEPSGIASGATFRPAKETLPLLASGALM